jgi:hypothetical protein
MPGEQSHGVPYLGQTPVNKGESSRRPASYCSKPCEINVRPFQITRESFPREFDKKASNKVEKQVRNNGEKLLSSVWTSVRRGLNGMNRRMNYRVSPQELIALYPSHRQS